MTITQHRVGAIPEWDIADRMSKALRYAGIGVSDMAAELAVSRETIGRWTNGRGRPPRAAVIAWASLTGVDQAWLEYGQLPRLDSNQQPSGYGSPQVSGGVGRLFGDPRPLPDPDPEPPVEDRRARWELAA